MTKSEYESRIQTACLAILTIVTIAVTLYMLRTVLVPFILAAFLTLVLVPIVDFLIRKLKIGRPIALFTTLFLAFMLLLGVATIVYASIQEFANHAGAYEAQLTKMVRDAENSSAGKLALSFMPGASPEEEIPTEVVVSQPVGETPESSVDPIESETTVGSEDADLEVASDPTGTTIPPKKKSKFQVSSLIPSGAIKSLTTGILSVISNIMLVMLFTAFLLMGSTTRSKPRTGVLGEIETRVQKYIAIKIVLSMVTGFLVYLVLEILEVKYAMSFGAFAFILNFIPNVGSVIATLLPVPIVLLTPDITNIVVILAIALPATIQLVIGNVLEPKIMGDTLGLHPVVVLMSLIFWGMLWGFSGMLLAVPMTAIAKIVFERIEMTKPLVGLMEGRLDTFDEM